jgi:hypothetical protein
MDKMLGRERKTVYKLIRGLNPAISDDETMQRAILMVAQIEGLMLFRLDKRRRRAQFDAVRASVRKALLALATICRFRSRDVAYTGLVIFTRSHVRMHHNISLITTIAAALGFGLLFGMLAVRLRLPALVGYLAAGVLIGPATPGFVADVALASQLAEIGVMLLMFGVGLHFSLDDLMEVKGIALPGAVLQIAVAT